VGAVGGVLSVDSPHGAGTTLRADIPLAKAELPTA
jgi:hypothetical protein